ncbi:sensor histidine kinase [Emticicia sp. BO119]|uniref:sensor histidine kinase n=1 Tax=Emticicia sp. BO119 TaxID=2757768 RepID=UPI0015F0FC7D|nr:histidine kinase [Emticicia sp. BO119]MBA4851259.1 histidine kinase [Emticicia sp. BO119]
MQKKFQIQLWMFHVGFWLTYLLATGYTFLNLMSPEDVSVRLTVNFILHFLFGYINWLYCIPRYFLKEKFILYFVVTILILVGFITTRVLLEQQFLSNAILETRIQNKPQMQVSLISLSYLMIWVLSSLFRLLDDRIKSIRVESRLRQAQLEAELKFLKSQINPHFLFNTLNNIYSLVYLKSDEGAPMLLKLSGILRYMLYESDIPKVPVQKEINYLKDCIDLHILNPKDRPKVQFEVKNESTNVMIEPLLFINFLENSFKHSSLSKPDGFIRIRLYITDKLIEFTIENSTLENTDRKDKVGGIGLQNIRQRLELIYPGKHSLEVRKTKESFAVKLKITP